MAEANKKIDVKNLMTQLEALTGYDYEKAERECRLDGDSTGVVTFSTDFQARIAANALEIPIDEVKRLPIQDYVALTTKVSNFLLSSLASELKAP